MGKPAQTGLHPVQSDLLLRKEDSTTFDWAQTPSESIFVPVDGFSLQSASAQQPGGHAEHPHCWKTVLGKRSQAGCVESTPYFQQTVVSSLPHSGKELFWTRTNLSVGNGSRKPLPFHQPGEKEFSSVILCLTGTLGPVLELPREPQTPSVLLHPDWEQPGQPQPASKEAVKKKSLTLLSFKAFPWIKEALVSVVTAGDIYCHLRKCFIILW